jgi:ribosomal protein S4
MFVVQQLAWAGLVMSQAEARRLIQYRVVNLNGQVVEDVSQQCEPGDILRIVRKGSRPDHVMQAGNGIIDPNDPDAKSLETQ